MKYIWARNLLLAFCSSIWFGGPNYLLSICVQSGWTLVDEFLMTVSMLWQENLLGQGEVTNNLLLVAAFVAQAVSFYHKISGSELHLQSLYLWHHIGCKRTPSMTFSQALVSFWSISIKVNAYWNQGKWKQTTTLFIKKCTFRKFQQLTN